MKSAMVHAAGCLPGSASTAESLADCFEIEVPLRGLGLVKEVVASTFCRAKSGLRKGILILPNENNLPF